jgi:hypothetical protein
MSNFKKYMEIISEAMSSEELLKKIQLLKETQLNNILAKFSEKFKSLKNINKDKVEKSKKLSSLDKKSIIADSEVLKKLKITVSKYSGKKEHIYGKTLKAEGQTEKSVDIYFTLNSKNNYILYLDLHHGDETHSREWNMSHNNFDEKVVNFIANFIFMGIKSMGTKSDMVEILNPR